MADYNGFHKNNESGRNRNGGAKSKSFGRGAGYGKGQTAGKSYESGQSYKSENGQGSGRSYEPVKGQGSGKGYRTENSWGNGQGYRTENGQGGGKGFGADKGHGTRQGYKPSGQGYGTDNGQGAGKGFGSGKGHGTRQGYRPSGQGNSPDSEQSKYAAGNERAKYRPGSGRPINTPDSSEAPYKMNRNKTGESGQDNKRSFSGRKGADERRDIPDVKARRIANEQKDDLTNELDKLEGRNSVLEALKSGRSINRLFVAKGDREGSVNQIIAMARQKHILIQEIDRTKLDAMSSTHAHQGVIALTAAKDYVEVEDILKIAEESGRPPFIIILDEITDSHNLGSILRTANTAGVHGVIIPKRRAVGLTSVVSKASAGAIEYVPVARVTNIAQTIEGLKKQNIWVVGTDASGEKAYFDADLTGPIALVIGSEGEGMSKLVRESCDFVVNIPMSGQITSLNAAVAGAVVTYDIFRQRSKKQP